MDSVGVGEAVPKSAASRGFGFVLRDLQRLGQQRIALGEVSVEGRENERQSQDRHRDAADDYRQGRAAEPRGSRSKADTARRELGGRHAGVVHAGDREAHDGGAATEARMAIRTEVMNSTAS